ncbi:MAG: methyl-accepting chemotaxis protein [Sphingomonas sp.]
MQAFINLKIATKIAALMMLLGLVTLVVVVDGATQIGKVDDSYSKLVGASQPNNRELALARNDLTTMVYDAYRTMAYDGNSTNARDAAEDQRRSYQSAMQHFATFEKREPALADHVATFKSQTMELNRLTSQGVAFGLRNQNEDARLVLQRADRLSDDMQASINQYVRTRIDQTNKASDDLSAGVNATSRNLMLMGFIGLVLGIGLAIFIARRAISGPLGVLEGTMRTLAGGNNDVDVAGVQRKDEVGSMAQAVLVFRDAARDQARAAEAKRIADAEQARVIETVSGHLETLAGGDLTQSITADFPESYVALKTNFNAAIASLRDLIQSVVSSAQTISSGASEIQQASEDLARRTEGSAASLEETAASIAQINDRLSAGAESAQRTVARADQAISTVQSGRRTADESVQAMGRVAESAKGIDSVIEGLDKIAFQTRVLAMNAAVEAGRAGEAGRGFAVVADLVGQLAMRSEEEAKRAREQLTATQTDVVLAVEAVQKVDQALVGISSDVDSVHQLLGEMSADNQAQAVAIQQINTAVGSLDQATQQNAAMVEEASAAARTLNAEVGTLSERARSFRVGDAGMGGGQPRPVAVSQKPKAAVARVETYQSPVKPLPGKAVAALVRDDDWSEF